MTGFLPGILGRMKLWSVVAAFIFPSSVFAGAPAAHSLVLKPAAFQHYVEGFNRDDVELYGQHIPNAGAWDWMQRNVPLFECPDPEIERTYFFRWWMYRKHIRQTLTQFEAQVLIEQQLHAAVNKRRSRSAA